MENSPFQVVNVATEYDNPYFSVDRKDIKLPNGEVTQFYNVGFEESVISLGIWNGEILFLKMYRPRIERSLIELPGGGVEEGESIIEAAKREFKEETGFSVGSTKVLGSFNYSAWTTAKRHFVWVDDLEPVDRSPPEFEIHQVEPVPIDEALETAIDSGLEWNITPLVLADRQGFLDTT